jgi:hypothetical protein
MHNLLLLNKIQQFKGGAPMKVRVQILAYLGLFLLTTNAMAQAASNGFYDKSQIKPFFSAKGYYGQLSETSIQGINALLFEEEWGFVTYDSAGTANGFATDATPKNNYGRFAADIFGFQLEIGAQYHQFLTWFNVSWLTPMAIVQKPAAQGSIGAFSFDYFDVTYDQVGFAWMFGYMLLPEDSRFNLIPSTGLGLSVINVNFPGPYQIYYQNGVEEMQPYTLDKKAYSNMGLSYTAEMEFRMNLAGGLSVGAFGGYRFAWYNEILLRSQNDMYYQVGSSETTAHNWLAGAKLTFTLASAYEKDMKLRQKRAQESLEN